MKKLGLLLIMLCGVSLFAGCPSETPKPKTPAKTAPAVTPAPATTPAPAKK